MLRPRRLLVAALTLIVVTLAGCAQTSSPRADDAAPGGGTRYPLTVTNCGEDVVFDAAPERVILLESAPVTILDGLGVLDRVVARAGSFPSGYYDDGLTARIDAIDSLSDDIDTSGHLTMSPEVVLAHEPDLALGLPEGVTREALRDSGVNALIHPVYCPSGVGGASFDTLYDQVRMYGEIFDRSDQAEEMVRELQRRVEAVERETADAAPRTAAVLYPSVGGGPLYAYGRGSMAQPQLAAAGFENVFSDATERVFEVSVEELIARDPDVLVLLHQGDEDGVAAEIASLPGSEALRALRNGDVLPQLFNFTEPPTPLSVTGLELIVERFGS